MIASETYHFIFRKLERTLTFSVDERIALSNLSIQIAEIGENQEVVREGDRPTRCFVLLNGFACSFKITGTGKRQVAAIHIPEDMPDLQSLHLPVLDFSIATLTPCIMAFIRHDAIRALCERHPRIGRALWRETLLEGAVGREWTTNVGQRPGASRVAHVICELMTRLRAVGRAERHIFDFPLNQNELGDATGMSTVHINRCVQELKVAGLIKWHKGRVEVLDWERLKAKADFDETYLHIGDIEHVADAAVGRFVQQAAPDVRTGETA